MVSHRARQRWTGRSKNASQGCQRRSSPVYAFSWLKSNPVLSNRHPRLRTGTLSAPPWRLVKRLQETARAIPLNGEKYPHEDRPLPEKSHSHPTIPILLLLVAVRSRQYRDCAMAARSRQRYDHTRRLGDRSCTRQNRRRRRLRHGVRAGRGRLQSRRDKLHQRDGTPRRNRGRIENLSRSADEAVHRPC